VKMVLAKDREALKARWEAGLSGERVNLYHGRRQYSFHHQLALAPDLRDMLRSVNIMNNNESLFVLSTPITR
jgi:hypothetical protein